MNTSVQTILDELSSLPHRGAATANGAKAAERLKSYLATMGARVQAERFETPRTYATIVYWLLGGLLTGLALVPVSGVSVGLVWYFVWMAMLYFNWRYSFIIRFPVQHTDQNVIGRWPARRTDQQPVRKIILMAHYDTAPISLLYSPKQQSSFRISLLVSLFLMLLAGVAATYEVFRIGLPYLTYLRYGLMGYFLLQAVIGTAGYWLKGYSNGASDNATGVAAALVTASRLHEASLPDVEIEVVLTSAEEVGMVGAYYYVKAHRKEWKPAQTLAINFDTLGAGKLTIVEKTGTAEQIRYDNEPTRLARELAKTEAFQHRTQVGRWHTADFDSVWFVRNKIPMLALCALEENGQMPRIHQPTDTLDQLDITPLHTAIDLAEAVVYAWLTANK